eukprot:1569172-Amphidinium_carterae.2
MKTTRRRLINSANMSMFMWPFAVTFASTMQRVKLLQHDWDLTVFGHLVAIWRSHDKDGVKSLEPRGALGRLLAVDYFGSGEIQTDRGTLLRGLKPRAMDENVLRISRSWNNVEQEVGQEQTCCHVVRSRIANPSFFCISINLRTLLG